MPNDFDTRSLGYRFSGALFAREMLGFDPDEKQALVLNSRGRGILNCSRHWGKSTTTAAKAVHRAYCWPESLVIVVSPSARQSGEFLRKAAAFAREAWDSEEGRWRQRDLAAVSEWLADCRATGGGGDRARIFRRLTDAH